MRCVDVLMWVQATSTWAWWLLPRAELWCCAVVPLSQRAHRTDKLHLCRKTDDAASTAACTCVAGVWVAKSSIMHNQCRLGMKSVQSHSPPHAGPCLANAPQPRHAVPAHMREGRRGRCWCALVWCWMRCLLLHLRARLGGGVGACALACVCARVRAARVCMGAWCWPASSAGDDRECKCSTCRTWPELLVNGAQHSTPAHVHSCAVALPQRCSVLPSGRACPQPRPSGRHSSPRSAR
jgi:hypothetical protein